MKLLSFLFLCSIAIVSCTSDSTSSTSKLNEVKKADAEPPIGNTSFFPVTNFLKGQINGIKQDGINPLIVTNENGKTDSVWLKIENFSTAFSSFLTPVIDSVNLITHYKETSFLDQTLGTYTFLYEPSKQLPDTFSLKRWDVYIDQESNKVKKIYLLKQFGDTLQHLTWEAGKWAKIITFLTKNDKETLLKETTIHWNFNE